MFVIASARKALVTGGARGFGRGVAERLVSHGAQVAIADVNDEAVEMTAAELATDQILPVVMDVTDSISVREGVRRAVEEFGGLDTLVNCAGVIELGPFEGISEEEWDWVLDVNLKGVFLCCQAVMTSLRESGRGCIVNIASDAGKKGWAQIAHYTASKFGVVGLTESLAQEFGPEGVRVNAVCPSTVAETGMGQKVLEKKIALGWGGHTVEEVLQQGAQSFPLQRLGTIADVADTIMFLISENAGWVSGESINIDGGALSG